MDRAEAALFIRQFVDSWANGFDAIAQGLREHLTQDCIWKNSGLPDVVGPEQGIALQQAARDEAGIESIGTDIETIVVDLPFVVVERLDHLIRADGSLIATLPVLGIFKLENGKIAAWHDYTDPSALKELMTSHG